MKTLLPAFAVGLLLGFLAGRVLVRPAPPPPPPPPRIPAPIAAAPPEPALATPPAPPTPPAVPTAPPPPTARLQDTRRVAELLSQPRPAEGHRELMRRARALLKEPEAQEIFLAELPALSREQLVVLWDVFWLGDVPQRLSSFGTDFAARFSRTLIDLYTTRTDPRDQELICNLLLPDLGSVSDARLERLRSLLAADANPRLRDKARQLPVR